MEDVAARTAGRVAANGIELAYETFGDPGAPPVVLIMGLATQMIAWPDEMCEGLARRGLFVVRFDNRDVGESTHLRDLPPPPLADIVVRRRPPPYSIGDMAADVAGLLDGLGLGGVHLVGASMGGFIAQAVALEHASRVRTLTLMMTSTGSRRVGQPKPRVYARLLRRRAAGAGPAAIAAAVETFRLIGSHGFAFDEQYVRDIAGRSWDRGYDPDGYRRQLAASASQPNRTADLRRVTVPALVMHGLHDPLVAPSGGLAIAKAIPGSRFVGFSGMGHDLPRALWPEFVREIAALAALGKQRRRQGTGSGKPDGVGLQSSDGCDARERGAQCRRSGAKSRSADTPSGPHPNGRSVGPVCANTHRRALCAATGMRMMVSVCSSKAMTRGRDNGPLSRLGSCGMRR